MRISTNQQFYGPTQSILDAQSRLFNTQNQLATGRRIVTPKDDPVGASRVVLIEHSQSVNSQYMAAQSIASSQLAMTESMLGSITNTLQSIHSYAVQGGDGAYSDTERIALATQIEQQLDSLVDMANTKGATGDYVFGGYRSNTQPFQVVDKDSGYIQYNGDGGSQKLQIEASSTVGITENGSEAFLRITSPDGTPTGESMFDSVKKMIDYLKTPDAPKVAIDEYNSALSNITTSIDHISRVRATVGSRMVLVESLNNADKDLDIQYATTKSGIADLDYAAAISAFNQEQTQLQAAQMGFTKLTERNLFDYL